MSSRNNDLREVGEYAVARSPDPQLLRAANAMRNEYRAAIALAGVPDPLEKVEQIIFTAEGPLREVTARLYVPPNADQKPLPIVVFAHGGGWVSGDFDTHEALVHAIAVRAHVLVLAINYRLAPENPFPAGLDDLYAGLQWVVSNASSLGGDPERVAVCGDSAGGNLAAALAMMARDRNGPRITAQWLMYPMLSHRLDTTSWQKYGTGYFPSLLVAAFLQAAYIPPGVSKDDPLVAPMWANHAQLPEALLQVGELDPLYDDAFAYAQNLNRAGGKARAIGYSGQTHGFMQFYQDTAHNALGESALDEGIAFLQAVFNG